MDKLTQETLRFLHLEAKKTKTILATAEEVAYFGPLLKKKIVFTTTAPIKIASPTPKVTPSIALAPIKIELPPSLPKPKPASDIHLAIQKVFPNMILHDTPPSDHIAKKMARLWEETYLSAKVVVIAFGETHLEFLQQVTNAIDRLLAPAQLLDGETFEKEHGWELLLKSPLLHTVVCSPWNLWKHTSLAEHYRQNGVSQDHFLAKRPLILLEPTASYLKEPQLKRKLWKDLNTHLSS